MDPWVTKCRDKLVILVGIIGEAFYHGLSFELYFILRQINVIWRSLVNLIECGIRSTCQSLAAVLLCLWCKDRVVFHDFHQLLLICMSLKVALSAPLNTCPYYVTLLYTSSYFSAFWTSNVTPNIGSILRLINILPASFPGYKCFLLTGLVSWGRRPHLWGNRHLVIWPCCDHLWRDKS